MQRKFLGDAYDFYKGAVLEAVWKSWQRRNGRLRVVPLMTDGPWAEGDIRKYARILKVNRRAICLCTELFTQASRKTYLGKIKEEHGDFFLDPDTGIAPASSCKKGHVRPEEILDLLTNGNVVAVYQHGPRRSGSWLGQYLQRLKDATNGTSRILCFGIECGRAGMVFATRSKLMHDRLKRAFDHLPLGRIVDPRT